MKLTFTAILLVVSTWAFAQSKGPNINDARNYGTKVLKAPPSGILKVDVSEEYKNVVWVELCGYKGSIPLACRENYNITMTTATGRKKTITDYKDVSFGTISPDEFPLTIDVKVTGLKGEERYPFEFSVKLLYPGFYYRVLMYEEWTKVKGIEY